jgi:HK97 family phage major capsid protein
LLEAEQRDRINPPKTPAFYTVYGDTNKDIANTRANKFSKVAVSRAFHDYVQGRDSKELRDITTGSTSGGFLIPLSFVPEMTQTLRTYGPFASLVNTKYGAQPQKFPLSDDSARNFYCVG